MVYGKSHYNVAEGEYVKWKHVHTPRDQYEDESVGGGTA